MSTITVTLTEVLPNRCYAKSTIEPAQSIPGRDHADALQAWLQNFAAAALDDERGSERWLLEEMASHGGEIKVVLE